MRTVDDKAIYKMVHQILDREYPHLLGGRYTQGIVTAVNPLGSVRVLRLGETAPDGSDWICAVPGYLPSVGDRVELVWANDIYGYVAFPLGPAKGSWNPVKARVYQAAGQSVSSGSLVALDTVVFDPMSKAGGTGMFSTGTHLLTLPVKGTYFVCGRVAVTSNADLSAGIHQAGSVSADIHGNESVAGSGNFSGSVIAGLIQAAAGDTIGLYADFLSAGATTATGDGVTYLAAALHSQDF